jgi:hypothetical protein
LGKEAAMLFSIGDYLAGMIVGAVTALAVRMVVWPGMDMVIAMIVGMALGMLIHIALGLVMAPVIGMFNAMMPASLIGMYGGMFFGMRDSMAAGSRTLQAAIVVGAILGAIVVAGVKYYDQILRGTVVDSASD